MSSKATDVNANSKTLFRNTDYGLVLFIYFNNDLISENYFNLTRY